MSLQSVSGLSFEFGGLRSIEIEVSDSPLTSDAGLLPVRQFDECLGFTERFADALVDERDPDGVRHSWLSMVRQRVYGMLAGYEDQNDHDTLRHDPVFQLICDRVPDDGTGPARATLASQPTLSRFEPPRAVVKTRSASPICGDCVTCWSISSCSRSTLPRRGSRWTGMPSTIRVMVSSSRVMVSSRG